MKRLIFILLLVLPFCMGAYKWTFETGQSPFLLNQFMGNPEFKNVETDTITLANGMTIDNANNNAYEWNENSEELIWTFASDAVNLSSTTGVVSMDFATIVPKSDQFLCDPVADAVGTTEGTLYYDSDDDTLKYRNASAWVSLTSGTGDNTLDNAYDQGGAGSGKKINADTGAVEIEVADTKDNPALHLDCDNSTNDPTALLIENAADAANAISIDIDAQTTGRDVEGTGASWHVTGAGVLTVADIQATTGTVTTLTSTIANITNLAVSAAMTNAANLTLDDGTTDSPTFSLKDATDETCAIVKKDNGDTEATIPADTDFEIVTGNLAVGNGTPGTAAMDGEDFYVNGDSEFDGSAQFDGTVTCAGTANIPTLNVTTLLNIDEEIDADFDNADEEMTITNSAQYGADGAQVTINNTDSDITAAMYLLRLQYTDDGDADADFIVCEDNAGDDMVTVTDGGSITAVGTVSAATIQATTLLDINEDVDIDLDANDEEVNIGSSATDYGADSALVTIDDSGAGQTNNNYMLRCQRSADGDAQDHFIVCEDNNGDDMFKVDSGGAVTVGGALTMSGGQTRKVMFQPKEIELDGTNPPTLTDHGTDGTCNISVLAFDADGGATGDDIAYVSWLVPDGYVVDSARLNVGYTFSTAEDAADEAQFDFAVNACAAGESLNTAGSPLADQTTVISDASADNGKLHITQYNIETEDIAVDDLVTIEIAVDESASALAASSTLDVLYVEIEYESTE